MTREVRATYRVQLTADFTFDDAAAIAADLADLGISHLYCSPYLQARPGSSHGYDVVDHRRISDALGGEEGHTRMLEALQAAGLGHILDVVPNHMTVVERANEWWWDVLKRGPASEFASYFDIDWDPPEQRLGRRILLPVLGDHYGRVLGRGELTVEADEDEWVVRYYDHVFPLDPATTEGLGAPLDPDALHELLEAQHYRLAYWKVAGQDLNYRRFFAINELAALRMENPNTFDRVHELVLSLVGRGKLDGLRIDHIDGLRDPYSYLQQLRAWCPQTYVVVEKILERDEPLRPDWPVQGTTGYEFMNRMLGVLIDPAAEGSFTETYERFTGTSHDYEAMERDAKLLLMDTELAADVERLTELFVQVCETDRDHRDHTRAELRDVLREVIAAFPVYRTYVRAGAKIDPIDRRYLDEAIARTAKNRPDLDDELLRFLRSLLEMPVELTLRFQQTTGPVTAKGVEDTLFYRYNRFVALNEVGGAPHRFGWAIVDFHAAIGAAPLHGMLATSTHDTKRSEDVRARLAVLTEIPGHWAEAALRWQAMNERHKRSGAPDPNDEYLLYQTLVGAWPIDAGRAAAYMVKAAKEAKVHTSWIDPDPAYDEALESFVRAVLADDGFVRDLETFVEPLVTPGRVNSLAQTLVKATAPGIPDTYQGCQDFDYSLVDPDNRRPVDHDGLRALAARVAAGDTAAAPKLAVLRTALRLRRERPELFDAPYTPVDAGEHTIAFTRGEDLLVAVPRWPLRGPGRAEIDVPAGWRDLLEDLPVALMVRDG